MQVNPVSAFSIYKQTDVRKVIKKKPGFTKKKNKFNCQSNGKSLGYQGIDRKLNSNNSDLKKHKRNEFKKLKRIEHARNIESNIVNQNHKVENDESSFEMESSIESKSETVQSMTEGLKLFSWLISPVNPSTFFETYWEKTILHLHRSKPKYYSHILSSEMLDRIFRDNPLYYTRNVDVVSYENGIKKNFNQEGRAVPAALWDYYANGCSIRLLNPQTYNKKTHLLLSTLQEYFGSMVGANVYLTPPGSQGFAPHFDDIEAFIVQLEGRKHWKLYKPKDEDVLARNSSLNFNSNDVGVPFKELTLEAGDLLYFPRGTIHEGRTDDDSHSLHITISVYQRNAYIDLFEHLLPDALKEAAECDVDFRKGLPLHYLQNVGVVNRTKSNDQRRAIMDDVKKLFHKLASYLDVDKAADKLGRKLMRDSMPPVLSASEADRTSRNDGDHLKNGVVLNRVEVGLDTKVRLLRYHCIRLVVEMSSSPTLYYCTENANVYHGEEEQSLQLEEGMLSAVEYLQNAFPEYVEVESLPGLENDSKVQLIFDLWERGIIVTEDALPTCDSGSEAEADESE